MKTIDIIKRFLAPTLKTPVVFSRAVFISMTWGIDGVIHVLFLERIVHFIELGDKAGFQIIIGYYLLYFVIFNIVFLYLENMGGLRLKLNL